MYSSFPKMQNNYIYVLQAEIEYFFTKKRKRNKNIKYIQEMKN